MSATVWVSLIGIFVGAVVALAVAHLHRKQMRQIELHRDDPNIPLVPPPHPITKFVLSYGIYIWCLGTCVYDFVVLTRDLGRPMPVTPRTVVFIVVDMMGIVLMIALAVSIWFGNRAIDTTFGLFKESHRIAVDLTGILKSMTERMLSMDARITKLEEAGKVTIDSAQSDSETPPRVIKT